MMYDENIKCNYYNCSIVRTFANCSMASCLLVWMI